MIQHEHKLQQAVHAYLVRALPSDAMHWGMDSAGKRSRNAQVRMKERGMIAGIHDMAVVYAGRLITIELKALNNRNGMSDGQRAFGDRLKQCGADWFEARCIEDVEIGLRVRGVPLRATALTAAERDALLATPKAPRKSKPRTVKPSVSRVRRVQAIMDGLHAREPLWTGVKR